MFFFDLPRTTRVQVIFVILENMKYVILAIAGFVLLMALNAFLGGEPF